MKNDMRFKHYKQAVLGNQRFRVSEIKAMNKEERGGTDSIRDALPQSIRCKNHQLQTIEQDRVCLAPIDTKRYWVDNVHSLPYGHWRIKEIEAGFK